MPLESAQMLSTVARILLPDDGTNCAGLYKSTHSKHPCVKWLHVDGKNNDYANIAWLYYHALELCDQYLERYNKVHKCRLTILQAGDLLPTKLRFGPSSWHSDPPQCMPEKYRIPNDPVAAYRAYYKAEKGYFAKWDGRVTPEWWH